MDIERLKSEEKSDLESSKSDNKAPKEDPSVQKKFRCLLANDEPMQLHTLKNILSLCDFDIETAINGLKAYQLVKESIIQSKKVNNLNGVNKFLYDLIVLDLNMPVLDGIEACKAILSELKRSKALKIGVNLKG